MRIELGLPQRVLGPVAAVAAAEPQPKGRTTEVRAIAVRSDEPLSNTHIVASDRHRGVSGPTRDNKCFRCGRVGHMKRDCPSNNPYGRVTSRGKGDNKWKGKGGQGDKRGKGGKGGKGDNGGGHSSGQYTINFYVNR